MVRKINTSKYCQNKKKGKIVKKNKGKKLKIKKGDTEIYYAQYGTITLIRIFNKHLIYFSNLFNNSLF